MRRRADLSAAGRHPRPAKPTHRAGTAAAGRPFALALLGAALLAGCAGPRFATPDNEPTLKTLAGKRVDLAPDAGIGSGAEERAIDAWQKFLDASPAVRTMPERAEAMRRLGDLEMDRTDSRLARGEPATDANGAPDYKAAATRYRAYLKSYPQAPDRDRVLYQLARAEEQGGDLAGAVKTLDALVAAHPGTPAIEEVQFRRGELKFGARDYAGAEAAYSAVLAGAADGTFRSRALYMQGWSRFKQSRLDEALQSFFGVFDLTLGPLPPYSAAVAQPAGAKAALTPAEAKDTTADDGVGLPPLPGLSRADRELVADTLRVTSISLAGLQGAASIPAHVADDTRRGYEVHVYRALGELYLRQERVKDAADAFAAFAQRQPLHDEAPALQARVIDIYQANGFGTLALEAKRDYVTRYAVDGDYRRGNPAGWQRVQPLLRTHLAELARHHHALALQSRTAAAPAAAASGAAAGKPGTGKTAVAKAPAPAPATGAGLPPSAAADVREAVRWYRQTIASFPGEPETAAQHFLMAELLVDDRRFDEAAKAYEEAAYDYAPHAKSADAGYAAVLAQVAREPGLAGPALAEVQRAGVKSGLRFADRFGDDPRSAAVLTRAAEQLFILGDGAQAISVAQRVLDRQPAAAPEHRRVAGTVIAHARFDAGAFAEAEKAYADVLTLVPANDAARGALVERQAAAIYKQGEQSRAAGETRDAVAHFERIAAVAPNSPTRAAAQYDAAAALIGLKDWAGATRLLQDFRSRFPQHPLQAEVTPKLALAQLEQQHWAAAADEFDRLAQSRLASEPALARDAAWQSADLREKAIAQGVARRDAIGAWERYVKAHPTPLEPAIEARHRIVALAGADGQPARVQAAQQEIVQADQAGGNGRTPRTRTLAAQAALALAQPGFDAYREVKLVEPLQQQLKLKKARMESALKAYAAAAEYGIADVTTAATFQTAAIYQDFGAALMGSQRPKSLSGAELEQYEVLLEEQAFPFEEKAIELHELNARRAGEGLYDPWVQRSFAALGSLRPVRYGKLERLEEVIDAIR